jgi:hypothetical protein
MPVLPGCAHLVSVSCQGHELKGRRRLVLAADVTLRVHFGMLYDIWHRVGMALVQKYGVVRGQAKRTVLLAD